MKNEELIQIKTKGNNYIALWKISNTEHNINRHVFLTHGTFSNRKVCMGIADFLVEEGYTCWVLEWRDHGSSTRTNTKFNFEIIAKEDVKLAFDYLFDTQKLQKIDCITHSGGGICLTITLIEYPEYRPRIGRMSFFACQVFGSANTLLNYLKIKIGSWGSFLLGYVPASMFGSEENETHYFMKQWSDWNLDKNFLSLNGFDYRIAMKNINVPILAVCGTGDTFIAPVSGCEAFLNSFENPQNKLLLCGKNTGYAEDYNHGRILHSRNARKEIYPIVLKWLNEH